MTEIVVNVEADGGLEFVYHDGAACLLGLGRPDIRRASHIEPTADGEWMADLSPVEGPVFGPFRLRHQALQAEWDWLLDNGF